jgi:hypothetical protein
MTSHYTLTAATPSLPTGLSQYVRPNLPRNLIIPTLHSNLTRDFIKIDHPQYTSKESFIAGQIAATSNPPQAKFTVIAWDHGCDTFTFRWRGQFVAGTPEPLGIAGIDLVVVQKGSFLLETAYSEYNNVLFLYEIGCKINCGG